MQHQVPTTWTTLVVKFWMYRSITLVLRHQFLFSLYIMWLVIWMFNRPFLLRYLQLPWSSNKRLCRRPLVLIPYFIDNLYSDQLLWILIINLYTKFPMLFIFFSFWTNGCAITQKDKRIWNPESFHNIFSYKYGWTGKFRLVGINSLRVFFLTKLFVKSLLLQWLH